MATPVTSNQRVVVEKNLKDASTQSLGMHKTIGPTNKENLPIVQEIAESQTLATIFNLPPQHASPVQPRKIPTLSYTEIESENSVAPIMDDAKGLLNLELEFAQTKKSTGKARPSQLLSTKRKAYFQGARDQVQAWDWIIAHATAFCHACQNFIEQQTESDHYLVIYARNLQKENLEKIAVTLEKKRNYKKPLQCLTFNTQLHVPSNHASKFNCVADTQCPTKNYQKANKPLQSFLQNYSEQGKKIKKELKAQIQKKVSEDLLQKSSSYGPLSFPFTIAYTDFHYQLEKCQKEDLQFHTQLEVLNETIHLLDAYYKNNGILSEDRDFGTLYAEMSYTKLPHNEANLYHFSEEFQNKKGPDAEQNRFDQHTKERLSDYLKRICQCLHSKIEAAQIVEIQEKKKLSGEEIEEITQLVFNYLMRLIKIHKNFSHHRFFDLFALHTNFLKRLQFIVQKGLESQQPVLLNIIHTTLSPKITLLETTKHRMTQARHDNKESSAIRKHKTLEKVNQYIRYLTLGDQHDMLAFECAHVVPFPALFARRDFDEKQNPLPRESKLKSASVSIEYMSANQRERDKKFFEDVNVLFKEYQDQPSRFIDHALEVLMKISLEEASHTVHIPSVFNQEVDGASEKYIKMNQIDSAESRLMASFQKKNQKWEEKSPNQTQAPKYTEKVYKYMISSDLFSMILDNKEFTFSEVMLKEANYILGVKEALAHRMHWIASQPKTVTNLLIALSLCNVFFGLKNTEALGNIDLTEAEKEIYASFLKLQSWIA